MERIVFKWGKEWLRGALISAAIFLMAIRRGFMLFRLLSGEATEFHVSFGLIYLSDFADKVYASPVFRQGAGLVFKTRQCSREAIMSGVISVTPQAIQANSVMQTVQDSAPVPKKHQSEQTKPQTTTDTVEISRSAQAAVQNAAKAAVDEATETASQTANEARNGDLQAQRLLVKEVVQKVSYR